MEEKVLNGSISKEAQAAMIRKERTANNAWHKFCRNKSAVVGLIIISLMILMGVLAPVLSPHDPNQINVLQTYLPPFSEGHILGTDDLGRDLLSRLLYGARMSIVVAIGATVLGGVIGIALGVLLAGGIGSLMGITAKASLSAICISAGVSLAVGVLFGYLPANKAAKLNPIDALRYD